MREFDEIEEPKWEELQESAMRNVRSEVMSLISLRKSLRRQSDLNRS
jgi:hypothetical protein